MSESREFELFDRVLVTGTLEHPSVGTIVAHVGTADMPYPAYLVKLGRYYVLGFQHYLEPWYGTDRQQHILDWVGRRGYGCFCSGPCTHYVPDDRKIKVRVWQWLHDRLLKAFRVMPYAG